MPTNSVQSLKRGLAILQCLNQRNGRTADDIALAVQLPRATTYRILETLRSEGFVHKTERRGMYWLADKVAELSDGYLADSWVDGSTPVLWRLSADFLWPVAIATPSGAEMRLRATTDHISPMVKRRQVAGTHCSMLESAIGRAYLAFRERGDQEILLDQLLPEAAKQRGQRALLMRLLTTIRQSGYSLYRHEATETQLAVPLIVAGHSSGVLAIRYFTSALSTAEATRRFLPALVEAACVISDRLSSSRALASANMHLKIHPSLELVSRAF